MTPESLSRALADFLSGSQSAVVIEDRAILFDLASARYSISGEFNKCLLHLWSNERNLVRRVLDLQTKGSNLRLTVQRLGQAHPTRLEFCRHRDPHSPSARRAARAAYEPHLRRALERHFPGLAVNRLTSAIDLKKSFGPVYARGLLGRGQSAFAVLGVNQQESQGSVDAALTFGILWLDVCRERAAGRMVVEGLKLVVPHGTASLIRERMAHLHRDAAKWHLYELDESHDDLIEIDCHDRGNLRTRLVHSTDPAAAYTRFADSIQRVLEILPEAEVAVLSSAEVAFRLHGLEFARARLAQDPRAFRNGQEIAFAVGAEEHVLDSSNLAAFSEMAQRASMIRHRSGPRHHPLWRAHPERWLESLVLSDVSAVDERLDPRWVYSQVPAFSAADRGMLDVLTTTRDARLVVLELKAEEDIHLPLQGLDYWSRVTWHHERGEFHRFGYFPGRDLSPQKPLLKLVAPALHVHPATDTLLRYFSPELEWEVLGIAEHWRSGVRVVFRKRPGSIHLLSAAAG